MPLGCASMVGAAAAAAAAGTSALYRIQNIFEVMFIGLAWLESTSYGQRVRRNP